MKLVKQNQIVGHPYLITFDRLTMKRITKFTNITGIWYEYLNMKSGLSKLF